MEDVVLSFLAGNPKRSPPFLVYPDRRTDIWSPHEPQAPKRDTLPESASANVCTPSKDFCAAAPLHISHMLPCSLPPYPCMTAKHLPHPPLSTHTVQLVPPPHMAYKPMRASTLRWNCITFLRDFFPFME